MSLLTSQYLTTAGTKQYGRGVEIQFTFLQDKINSGMKFYFDNSSLFPQTLTTATSTPVAPGITGTNTYDPAVYDPTTLNGVSIVDSSRQGTRLTSSAANGSLSIPVTGNLSYERYVILAIRSSSATAVNGKLTVESSTGNNVVQSFVVNSTVGQQQIVCLDTLNPTSSTGSFNPASPSKVTVSLDATTTSVELLGGYSTAEKYNILGTKVDLRIECLSDVSEDRSLDSSDLICRQLIKDQIATKDGLKYTIKYKQGNLDLLAAGMGATMTTSQIAVQQIINSDLVGKGQIASNTFTIGQNQKIAFVKVGTNEYRTSPVATTTNLIGNEFHYNPTTGVITFPSANGLNGAIPTIVVWSIQPVTTMDVIALTLGRVGYLWMPSETQEGPKIITIASQARLSLSAKSAADDGDERTATFTVLPNASGKLITMGVV